LFFYDELWKRELIGELLSLIILCIILYFYAHSKNNIMAKTTKKSRPKPKPKKKPKVHKAKVIRQRVGFAG